MHTHKVVIVVIGLHEIDIHNELSLPQLANCVPVTL